MTEADKLQLRIDRAKRWARENMEDAGNVKSAIAQVATNGNKHKETVQKSFIITMTSIQALMTELLAILDGDK